MKCPLCKCRNHVEVDLHADGFAENIRECGECGGVWSNHEGDIRVIKGRVQRRQTVNTNFVCPTCKCIVTNETDLDAFQFHEEIYSCDCGTVCSVVHDMVHIIKDSQEDSFLATPWSGVEANDYSAC